MNLEELIHKWSGKLEIMNDINCIYDDAKKLNVKEEVFTSIFEATSEHSGCRENVSESELEKRVSKSLRLKGIVT